MIFKREDLEDLRSEDCCKTESGLSLKIVHKETVNEGRWETTKEIVFTDGYKFWRTSYSEGNTEYQDSTLFGSEDEIECREVIPREKVITVYDNI